MRTRTRASAKAAGREWEKAVATYLEPVFPYVERRRQNGNKDRGDLVNTRPWVIECKATKVIDLAGGVNEAEVELANDEHADWWALVVKRRAKSVEKGYVVMDLQQFRDLLAFQAEVSGYERRGTDEHSER